MPLLAMASNIPFGSFGSAKAQRLHVGRFALLGEGVDWKSDLVCLHQLNSCFYIRGFSECSSTFGESDLKLGSERLVSGLLEIQDWKGFFQPCQACHVRASTLKACPMIDPPALGDSLPVYEPAPDGKCLLFWWFLLLFTIVLMIL